MKAMILAAGRGQRMGGLTANTPKPLLTVKGQSLLENKIELLKQAGIVDLVINVAYLGEQIQQFAGDGSRWQVNIQYSVEPEPLETGGGIYRALPLLGDSPFLAINADIWCDYPLQTLANYLLPKNTLGYLVMVDNPRQHQQGDFQLADDGLLVVANGSENTLTFSGIAIYHPDFIRTYPNRRERFQLLEVYQYWIAKQQLRGEYYQGVWNDIGTPERLASVN